jgi:hypothetical protein
MTVTLTPHQEQAARAAIRAGQVASVEVFIERALADLLKRMNFPSQALPPGVIQQSGGRC